MAIRLKDIAADLGVSTVTVSKVLRGHPDIGERTRELVLKRMKELNYRPNMLARGLASGRSDTVGLVVPDLVHPFFGEFARAVGGVLRASGQALIVASSEEDPEVERQEIQALLSRGVDVLLLASCDARVPEDPPFGNGGTPWLLVDRDFPAMEANFVGSDDVAVGVLATQHLLSVGRRKVAHIGGDTMSPSAGRLMGYRQALAEAGFPERPEYILSCKRIENRGDAAGFRAMEELLRLPDPPDAVFCYNDLSAIGAMQAAMAAGRRVPEDVAFVGCGNLRYAEYLKVPLTSIDQDVQRMGEVAAHRALELVKEPACDAAKVLLPSKIVIRASSVNS